EVGRLHVVDRLRAAIGREVVLGLVGCGPVRGSVRRVGPDWLLLHDAAGSAVLVVLAATLWVEGLPRRAVDPAAVSAVDQRLGVRVVLRTAARDRALVQVRLRDGSDVRGTVNRVGADFVEIGAEPRAAGAERCIPLTAITLVRLR
ncbi:MAG: hypothetical protein JO079_15030, partial [Frankiaceae bacterium]|nr:hypothetical protein [Frankiaceae bacterium]